MKIVLDANVFVSVFIGDGNPKTVVKRVQKGEDILFISNDIIAELNSVFRKRKFHLTEEIIKYRVAYIQEISTCVSVSERITAGGCRDETDNRYLECAVAANADYVISGDKHLLELKEFRAIKIVKPAEYLEIAGGG